MFMMIKLFVLTGLMRYLVDKCGLSLSLHSGVTGPVTRTLWSAMEQYRRLLVQWSCPQHDTKSKLVTAYLLHNVLLTTPRKFLRSRISCIQTFALLYGALTSGVAWWIFMTGVCESSPEAIRLRSLWAAPVPPVPPCARMDFWRRNRSADS